MQWQLNYSFGFVPPRGAVPNPNSLCGLKDNAYCHAIQGFVNTRAATDGKLAS